MYIYMYPQHWRSSRVSANTRGDVYVLSKAPGWNVSVGWDEVDTPKAGNLGPPRTTEKKRGDYMVI